MANFDTLIAAELKELVSYGVIPRKIGRIPALTELLGLKGMERSRVSVLRDELKAAVDSLDGQYQIQGYDLPTQVSKPPSTSYSSSTEKRASR